MLTSIRNKNICLNVTGVLFYHRGHIMQIIEGEYDTIIELFERIKLDERHTNVVKLIDFKITERSYSNWTMAFNQFSESDWVSVNGYIDIEDKQVSLPKNSNKYAYLKVIIDSFMIENNILQRALK